MRLVELGAQYRLRRDRARHHETMPNQINPPTGRLTLRWAMHVLDWSVRVRVTVNGQARDLITTWHAVKNLHSYTTLVNWTAIPHKGLRAKTPPWL